MIRHIVLFKMRKDVEPSVLGERLPDIKRQFDAMVGVLPTLRTIEVGINSNPSEAFHLALTASFDDMAGLKSYADDPRHLAVVRQIKEMLEVRACVDYEV